LGGLGESNGPKFRVDFEDRDVLGGETGLLIPERQARFLKDKQDLLGAQLPVVWDLEGENVY